MEQLRTTLKDRIHIIFSDFRMPGKNGARFLQTVKEEFGDEIMRVIITAVMLNESSFQKEADTCKPHLILPKPILIKDLQASLSKLLGTRQE